MSADRLQRVGSESWVDAEHVIAVKPYTVDHQYRPRTKILLDSGGELIVSGKVDDIVRSLA